MGAAPRGDVTLRRPQLCERMIINEQSIAMLRYVPAPPQHAEHSECLLLFGAVRTGKYLGVVVQCTLHVPAVLAFPAHASALLATADEIRLLVLKRPQTDINTGIRCKIGM